MIELEIITDLLPPGRPFGMDAQTFFQVIANFINFAVLAFLMAILLYRPVRNVLNKRNERIQGQLAQAEDDMAKATELRLSYEQKIKDISNEREEVLSEARRQAAETSRVLISEAKAEADAIRERASAEVKSEWERARPDVRTAIIEVSAVMAEKFVTLTVNKETYDRIFAETIADLEV